MNTLSPRSNPDKTDRIERGILLHASGHVTAEANDRWNVRSQSKKNITYSVTASHCECVDSEKARTICKHMWSSAGYKIACIIVALRKADSLRQAAQIMTCAEPGSLPDGYGRTLQEEYAVALKRLVPTETYFKRECSHIGCSTTRCDQARSYGGIQI